MHYCICFSADVSINDHLVNSENLHIFVPDGIHYSTLAAFDNKGYYLIKTKFCGITHPYQGVCVKDKKCTAITVYCMYMHMKT